MRFLAHLPKLMLYDILKYVIYSVAIGNIFLGTGTILSLRYQIPYSRKTAKYTTETNLYGTFSAVPSFNKVDVKAL